MIEVKNELDLKSFVDELKKFESCITIQPGHQTLINLLRSISLLLEGITIILVAILLLCFHEKIEKEVLYCILIICVVPFLVLLEYFCSKKASIRNTKQFIYKTNRDLRNNVGNAESYIKTLEHFITRIEANGKIKENDYHTIRLDDIKYFLDMLRIYQIVKDYEVQSIMELEQEHQYVLLLKTPDCIQRIKFIGWERIESGSTKLIFNNNGIFIAHSHGIRLT